MDPNSLALLMGSAGGGPTGPATYVEDVFQTWLHTGNNSTLAVANGIDLSTKGGMVWLKSRSAAGNNFVCDTARGVSKLLLTNTTDPNDNVPSTSNGFASFDTNGFTLAANYSGTNVSGTTYASWTFRKQAKFFDVVTYTGTGANRTIAHSLGSTPGCIIVKRTDAANDWVVYHRSLPTPDQSFILLNSTAANDGSTYNRWGTSGNVSINSSNFSVGTAYATNQNGGSFVAYLFAHDAGGFGASGSDSVVKCGSFTTNGSGVGNFVDLGWEPQFVLVKSSSTSQGWWLFDNMRGIASGGADALLVANTSAAEDGGFNYLDVSATGFQLVQYGSISADYIYIAIRRGPMKTPTDATTVFSTNTAATSQGTKITTSFPVDLQITSYRSGNPANYFTDRLRGVSTNATGFGPRLSSTTTDAESGGNNTALFWDSTGYQVPSLSESFSTVWQSFRRAPGFFDVVAYTGTGSARTVSHNLGVAPELMIVKRRSTSGTNWSTYVASLGNDKEVNLNLDLFSGSSGAWNNTTPTSSVFSLGSLSSVNANGSTYIAYLFASCPGVSKVGSYTGTGTTLSVDCGFTAGARFVLIKRTDDTGAWYVWDTARGIVSGNDPYLLLNSTAAQITNTDYIDPLNAGFQISSTAPAAINANGGSYIYLSVA